MKQYEIMFKDGRTQKMKASKIILFDSMERQTIFNENEGVVFLNSSEVLAIYEKE